MSKTADQRIRFACQQCDQLLSIGASKVGVAIKCPKCRHANEVPAADFAKDQLAERKKRKAAERQAVQESGEDFPQYSLFDQDSEFVFEQGDDGSYYVDKRIDPTKVAVPRLMLYLQGALLGVVALGMFAFGWFVGAARNPPPPAPPVAAAVEAPPGVVQGTLQFLDKDKHQQPDPGSVAILLPQTASPEPGDRVDFAGLRPADPPADETHPALQRIAVLGGAYARADAAGGYRLQAPVGAYYLLLISNSSQRGEGEKISPEQLAEIERYFTSAADLLGDRRFRWSPEQIDDDARQDYVFGQP